jgi:hypothetical protein
MPWELASFANVTSYDKGINGVIIDVAQLPTSATPSTSDFSFRSYRPERSMDEVGIPERPRSAAWVFAPRPRSLTVRRGEGAGGSDRVTLVWDDRGTRSSSFVATFNRWLEVTVKATPGTGLAQNDVFFFANLVGETGDGRARDPESLQVTAVDIAATRRATAPEPAPPASRYDHNRDGLVNALDVDVVRSNLGTSLSYVPPRFASTAPTGGGIGVFSPASALVRDEQPGSSVA